jgi:hypothetical protein
MLRKLCVQLARLKRMQGLDLEFESDRDLAVVAQGAAPDGSLAQLAGYQKRDSGGYSGIMLIRLPRLPHMR